MDAQSLHKLYRQHLRSSDPPLPPYLAAVRTLTAALSESQQPLHTLAETLALLSSLSTNLKSTLPAATAIAISAGTDTFQRQLVTSLARGAENQHQTSNGADTRSAVIRAGEDFIQKHLSHRQRIAKYGPRFIRPGMTLVVPSSSPSRNVESMLRSAAEADIPFRVIFVREEHAKGSEPKPTWADAEKLRKYLEETETPNAIMSTASLAHAFTANSSTHRPEERGAWPPSQTILLADAVALLASGGALASLETQTAAAVACAMGREVWIVAESGKCVRDMGVGSFSTKTDHVVQWAGEEEQQSVEDALDVTPPEFITGVITEDGPRSTTAIAEEAIKLWF